jgi:nucleotide-binding universal stress UspA family protein
VMAPPVEALTRVAQAREASEIVVGARGLGRFRAALGSVSHGPLQ